MGTQFPDLFAALSAEWPPHELGRLKKAGNSFGYLRAEQVMDRLDDVLGGENWWADFERDSMGSDSVICRLTIRLPDGSTVTKADLGAPQGMADDGDDDKSAMSDALKRASVHFGVGRWLRRKTPGGAPDSPAPAKERTAAAPDGKPPRGQWGNPKPHASAPSAEAPAAPVPGGPQTGGAFFAWLKDREKEYNVDIIKYISTWANHQDWPMMMKNWTREQVRAAHAEAVRKLASRGVGTEAAPALAN